tara:strand:- start:736 stop:1626 length:891 start_codon:yes stop_codon:yes gene_type:complete
MNGNLFNLIFPQMNPAEAVSTGVAHSNIDNLMGKSSDYGKPFEYVSTNVGTPKAVAIPLNMSRYAELIDKSGIGESLYSSFIENIAGYRRSKVPLSAGFLDEPDASPDKLATGRAKKSIEESQKKAMRRWSPEQLQNYIVSKLKKGDSPSGIVAYHLDEYTPKEGVAGHYIPGSNFFDPDTIKLYQSMQRVPAREGMGEGISRGISEFDFLGDKASGEYGSTLHEAIHAIFGHPESSQDSGSQRDYKIIEKQMASNLKQWYGESLMKALMDNLLVQSPLTMEDTSKINQLGLDKYR